MPEPKWTRVRPGLNQMDYVVTDPQLMEESSVGKVYRTDIGASDHFFMWYDVRLVLARTVC